MHNAVMAATIPAAVPLSEYLGRTYHPDCDYLEGVLEERNVGEIGHAEAQGRLYLFLQTGIAGFWSGVEVRVQVKADRFRIPTSRSCVAVNPPGA